MLLVFLNDYRETEMSEIIKGGGFLIADVEAKDIFIPEDFTDEHKAIKETTADLVTNEIMPHIEQIDTQDWDLVKELFGKCGEMGLLMTDAPEEYGGLELDKVTSMIVAGEMAHTGAFSVSFSAHTGIGTLPTVYYGTPEQKEKYLEKIITGEWVSAYCLTEPGSGSDAMTVDTVATLDGDNYILNGTKQFITNAGFANLFTVFAKIDKEHFTAFLVERDMPGVSIGPEEKKLGIKGSSTCQVILTDAKIPKENLLGEIGKGHKIAFNVLNMGRLKLAAAVNGAAKEAIKTGAEYAKERKQFGQPIANFGAIQEKFADQVAGIFAADSLVYRIAGNMDSRINKLEKGAADHYTEVQKAVEEYSAECAIAKVFCSDQLSTVVDEVLQIHGGYGFTTEYAAERYYRDERINRIFEGTNEINRMLIPGTILKKAMKGELPLNAAAMKAVEGLMVPSFDELDDNDPFANEKLAIKNAKQIFLILSGLAVQKFMAALSNEQEILMAAADVAISIYAMESAVLRAEKAYPNATDKKKELYKALAVTVCSLMVEKVGSCGRRGAFYVEEGDNLMMMLSGIRRYSKYNAEGLLAAKRLIAKETLDSNGYPI